MSSIKYHPFNRTLSLLIAGMALLSGGVTLAQETRSTILGTVKDPSGAVVSGATVDVTNTETNATTKLSTNTSGYFEARYLLPGIYQITVTAQGFKKYVPRHNAMEHSALQSIPAEVHLLAVIDRAALVDGANAVHTCLISPVCCF